MAVRDEERLGVKRIDVKLLYLYWEYSNQNVKFILLLVFQDNSRNSGVDGIVKYIKR